MYARGRACIIYMVPRWRPDEQLNALFPLLPPGTLAANCIGGYAIGVAVTFFAERMELPQSARSSGAARLGEVATHVAASLLMTFRESGR